MHLHFSGKGVHVFQVGKALITIKPGPIEIDDALWLEAKKLEAIGEMLRAKQLTEKSEVKPIAKANGIVVDIKTEK